MDNAAIVRERIMLALSPSFLEVIDESDQHVGHAAHQDGGRHVAVRVSSAALHGVSRVEQHRKIYALFSDLMPHHIHALRIVVL